MTTYQVTASSSKTFLLTRNEQTVGNLTYETWFSSKATIDLEDSLPITIQPKGIWETSLEVKQAETILFDLELKWNGQLVLDRRGADSVEAFTFKQKSLTDFTFVLLSPDAEELLSIKPSIKWNRVTTDYQLFASDSLEHLPDKDVLLLLAVHCANYYLTTIWTTTLQVAS
ncbi:hypothetical protein [Spirosoma pomorum]